MRVLKITQHDNKGLPDKVLQPLDAFWQLYAIIDLIHALYDFLPLV
jgi:hypothetical protein